MASAAIESSGLVLVQAAKNTATRLRVAKCANLAFNPHTCV